jgi:hypothetical protein
VDFSVTGVLGGSVSILIYAILILLGFNIYANVAVDFQENPDKFYDRVGQQASKSILPYITKGIPSGANLNEPIANYFRDQVAADPSYNQVPAYQKQQLIDRARQAFADQFQISVSDNRTLGDVLAQVAMNKIKQATAPYQQYLLS